MLGDHTFVDTVGLGVGKVEGVELQDEVTPAQGFGEEHGSEAAGRSADKQARIAEREQKRAAEREQRRLKNRVQKLERQIDDAEQKKQALELELERAYSGDNDAAQATRLTEELRRVSAEIESLYQEWEEAAAKVRDN